MVVSFDTEAELRSELVDDPETADAAIRDLRAGGGTALYDAIYFACRDKLSQDQPMHKFRRAMVIVSDGDDNHSRYTRDQALERAQKDRSGDLRHIHQHQPRRDRWRQGAEVLHQGNRRAGLFPLQGGRHGAVLRGHRQRAAAPVQPVLPARASGHGWPVPPGRAAGERTQGPGGSGAPGYYAPKM